MDTNPKARFDPNGAPSRPGLHLLPGFERPPAEAALPWRTALGIAVLLLVAFAA